MFILSMAFSWSKPLSFSLTRMVKFEFWPFWIFYFPMYFYGLYLALRARSFMYFSTTNPGMKYGGVMGESKYKVLSSIPHEYIPKTSFLKAPISKSNILKIIDKENFSYPFIIKPDVGERGKDVELIDNESELLRYLKDKSTDLIIQEYIGGGLEFGIMYHRMPGSDRGEVTSVVEKGFLSVTGNGDSTIRQLIEKELRAAGRLDYLYKKFEDSAEDILPKGEKLYLEPIGNHCRGTTFYNANTLISDKLNDVINTIATRIDGYFYGRFDLKVPNLHDLYAGKNIKVLELNGVSSEVAHIYDPDYKLMDAYKDIARHMKYIAEIACKNHELGVPYDSLSHFLKDLRIHFKSH